jgi:micrococcal nuclease
VKVKKKSFLKKQQNLLILRAGAIFFLLVGLMTALKPSPAPTPTSNPSPFVGTFKVVRVIDGDTIEIEGGERVRYIGIDTPETVDPRKPVQCFGFEASEKNKELVEGKEVRLEKDVTDRDKYGRLLRYVYVNSLFVNLELVKQGFAFSYTYPPDVKHQAEILAAEEEARKAKRGLWKACPILTATPT